MADDGLIESYLRELAFSVRGLPDRDDIVAEAADHLYTAAEALATTGASHEAQAAAVARFGSAALIARVCIIESKRGAAVPTTRTRQAGLAAVLAPLLLIVGQLLNVSIPSDRGPVHGVGVVMLAAAFPAMVFGLWGLVHRHGGLGPLGRAGFVLAACSAPLSLLAGWAAAVLLGVLVAIAIVAVSVQMLRAGVLPVVAVAMVGGGAASVLVALLIGVVAIRPLLLLTVPAFVITVVGFSMLGWYLWREPAVDRRPIGPATAT
jgi:hypothetical protein